MISYKSVHEIDRFGDVAAEDDSVLDYFVTTNAVQRISDGVAFVVLGRKGTGKTAIVRHFTEGGSMGLSTALNLRNYPWRVHATRIDSGVSDIEAYVSSWRYLVAVELAALVLSRPDAARLPVAAPLREFLQDNYGGVTPDLSDILRPKSLKLSKFSFQPAVLGNQLGSIDLERKANDFDFGSELNALTVKMLDAVFSVVELSGIEKVSLHFDELDQGLSTLDASRSNMMIGLVLACRETRRAANIRNVNVNPVVYLRTDIWDDLQFSDKNKISETLTLHLSWNSEDLLELVNQRLRTKLGADVTWDLVVGSDLMRGSQTKWNHILARTFQRPRDVIRFLNTILDEAKKRSERPLLFTNKDIVNSREAYSSYLKSELDDEIRPHWYRWDRALQACSAISTITFDRSDFEREFDQRNIDDGLTSAEALRQLFRFSVIGYDARSGYGGSSWVFQYTDPESGWDNTASKFKVHLGLKEYAKLREERK